MRRATITLICLLCLLALPAAAQAKAKVGFSEQRSEMFDDPLFKDLGTRQARLIVSYDAVLKNTFEVADIDKWMAGAQADGVRPLVSFNYSRGCFADNKIPKRPECRLPSVATYTKAFKAFRTRYPFVKDISPWNEINHFSQPTSKNPKRAAQFTMAAKKNCRGCTIVAADMLDQKGMASYLSKFKRALKGTYKVWGLHNYSDTNRFRNKGTKQFLRLVPGQVWLTETGGVVTFGKSFPFDVDRAAKATKFMFKLAATNKRITRLYIYQWSGANPGDRFDAGVLGPDGKPRPAYDVVKKALGK
jgi:hypothetical protein